MLARLERLNHRSLGLLAESRERQRSSERVLQREPLAVFAEEVAPLIYAGWRRWRRFRSDS